MFKDGAQRLVTSSISWNTAPVALVTGSITINNPQVVSKSYPHFWDDLKESGFGITESE